MSTQAVADQVARNVRGALAAAQITQGQMASVLKMSRSAFSQRVNGRKAFELEELSKISQATGVPFKRLVDVDEVAFR